MFVNPPLDLNLVGKHALTHFLDPTAEPGAFNLVIALASNSIAAAGIGLAYMMYRSQGRSLKKFVKIASPAHLLFSRGYYFDALYEEVLTRKVLYLGLARSLDWVDKSLIDGLVRLIDRLGVNAGRAVAQLQTGQLQGYGVAISIGVLAIAATYIFIR